MLHASRARIHIHIHIHKLHFGASIRIWCINLRCYRLGYLVNERALALAHFSLVSFGGGYRIRIP